MPCLFLRNIPPGVFFDPEVCRVLYERFAAAAGTTPDYVEVHIENTRYKFLGPDGQVRPHGVHGFVEWFAGRTNEAKAKIAAAIHDFLVYHNIGEGSDITFRDSPAGTFYI